ncbi:MAG: hypothetical protein ACI9VX_002430, partial [Dinoroseobacter sp.]
CPKRNHGLQNPNPQTLIMNEGASGGRSLPIRAKFPKY